MASTRGVAAAAAASSSSSSGRRSVPFLARRTVPFGQQKQLQQSRGIGSITSMRQSTAVESDLETKLGVSHPAYEVIEKDVVSEYGAYCTLYKHKKSGAELLSVSSDDDNKVRTYCIFRRPYIC